MKIRMEIAQGYRRGELQRFIESRAGSATPLEATREWVDNKYGTWVRTNLTEDFTIPVTTASSFVIDFTSDAAGSAFKDTIGGRVVDEA